VKVFPLTALPERFPVTVRLDAVVEARVDEPEIAILAPVRLEMFAFVDVLLVIVPFVALMLVRLKFPADNVVMVAEVIVAFVPIKLSVLVVLAFEVEAYIFVN
jgi:hypothetical protein